MRVENIRVLFFGTPLFASKILESLCTFGYNVCGVITQPTKKSGRGALPKPSLVMETASKYSLLVYQPFSNDELFNIVQQIKPDIIVVAAYGRLIPGDVLAIPPYGSLNVHGSLLPKYRGSSPIPAAILNGDKETGITIMRMEEGLDAGPIVSKVKVRLDFTETTTTLYNKLADVGASEIIQVIPPYIAGKINIVPQNENKATYCTIIKKEDGLINWHRSALDIERQIRAFTPWPNAYTQWNGKLLKILEGQVVKKVLEPGNVVALDKSLLIGCGQDSLDVSRLQIEAKKEMSVIDFINGYKIIDEVNLS